MKRRCSNRHCRREVEHKPKQGARRTAGGVSPPLLVPVAHNRPDGQPCPNGQPTGRSR